MYDVNKNFSRPSPRAWQLASLVCALLLASGLAFADAQVKQVSGKVEIGRGEPPLWSDLEMGTAIVPNDRVRTGPDGRVEIAMEAGTLRVHENSMLRLPPAKGDADQVELDEGHSLFDVLRRAGRRFEVHTPTVVVSVKGTRFGVDASGDVGEVAVYRGMVGVREAGSSDALETLVREGFLATGGPGAPIELDVAPSEDPWASWQDFRREVRDMRETPKRLNDLDRAKASLLRNTDGEVLRRAAERKPEVAERLRKHQMKQAARERLRKEASDEMALDRADKADRRDRPSAESESMPAAPMIGGKNDKAERKRETIHEMMRGGGKSMGRDAEQQMREARDQMRDAERAQEEMDSDDLLGDIDLEDMTGGTPFANGELELDFDAFEDAPYALIMMLASAFQDLQSNFQSSGTSWTPDDVLASLEESLIRQGLDAADAREIVDGLMADEGSWGGRQ